MEKKLNDEVLQDVNGGGNVSVQNGTNKRSQWAGPSFNIGDKVYYKGRGSEKFKVYNVYSNQAAKTATCDLESLLNQAKYLSVPETSLSYQPFPS